MRHSVVHSSSTSFHSLELENESSFLRSFVRCSTCGSLSGISQRSLFTRTPSSSSSASQLTSPTRSQVPLGGTARTDGGPSPHSDPGRLPVRDVPAPKGSFRLLGRLAHSLVVRSRRGSRSSFVRRDSVTPSSTQSTFQSRARCFHFISSLHSSQRTERRRRRSQRNPLITGLLFPFPRLDFLPLAPSLSCLPSPSFSSFARSPSPPVLSPLSRTEHLAKAPCLPPRPSRVRAHSPLIPCPAVIPPVAHLP